MADFTWLHLSDLHFQQWENVDGISIYNKLIAKISSLKRVDYLFLTGDLAHKGNYTGVKNKLQELILATKVEADHIFWTPGNHDLVRGNPAREHVINSFRDNSYGSSRFEPFIDSKEGHALLYSAHKRYKKAYCNCIGQRPGLPYECYEKEDVNIIFLDTCITSCDDKDPHHLLLCSPQLIKTLEQIKDSNKPTIALGHHSVQFLSDIERVRILDLFQQYGVHLYLCGHAHRPEYFNGGKNTLFHEFTCGATQFNDPSASYVFFYGAYHAEENYITIIPYAHNKNIDGTWHEDYNVIEEVKKQSKFQLGEIIERASSDKVPAEDITNPFPFDKTKTSLISKFELDMEQLHLDSRVKKTVKHCGQDKAISLYSQLFQKMCISPDNWDCSGSSILYDLSQLILTKTSDVPLLINGTIGSGKSTFLSILYEQLKLLRTNQTIIYFDIRTYESLDSRQAKSKFEEHSQEIINILNESDRALILLIDGLNDFDQSSRKGKQELTRYKNWLNTILEFPVDMSKRVVAIGTWDESTQQNQIPSILGGVRPEHMIQLNGFDVNGENVRLFLKTQIFNPNDLEKIADAFINTLNKWKLSIIDFRFLCIMLDAYQKKGHRLDDNFSGFLKRYCVDHLAGNQGSLEDRAKEVFMSTNPYSAQASFNFRNRPLFFRHIYVLEFLVGYCLFNQLLNGLSSSNGNILRCNILFPENTNKIIKELIRNCSHQQIQAIQDNISRWLSHNEISLGMRMQLCYLISRILDSESKNSRYQTLTEELTKAESLESGEESVLLQRTIACGLATMGYTEHLTIWINKILSSTYYQTLNLKFYCNYYAYPNSGKSLKNILEMEITPSKAEMTLKKLYQILKTTIGQQSYSTHALFIIDVITYFNLIQLRFEISTLNSYAGQSCSLLKTLLHDEKCFSCISKVDSACEYLYMLEKFWELKSPIGILEKVYQLKTFKRSGWESRGYPNGESIADHICGLYYLGLYLLPNNPPKFSGENYEGYDKNQILKLIMLHDIGEAIDGDIQTQKKTEEDRRNEQKNAYALLSAGAYKCISNLQDSKTMLQEYYGKKTINGILTYELDKIENLVQLYIYEQSGLHFEDSESWKRFLRECIKTELGKSILTEVDKYFSD